MSAVRWLIKCGVGAAIVLIACGFATVRFGSGLQMPATTTRDGTLITLSRYLREPVPDIVLAGSSITFRGDTNPELYVVVMRDISGVQARVTIAGPLSQPELRLHFLCQLRRHHSVRILDQPLQLRLGQTDQPTESHSHMSERRDRWLGWQVSPEGSNRTCSWPLTQVPSWRPGSRQ
jgi:hypothetical protein